jgi:crotonobetainyl-CoA:carnitine CoA-transferase CaiB-like acyl-CoA transferase
VATPPQGSQRPAPLAGVRVLDLSRLLPGPLAAQHLADLGAHVIKIEDPKLGDYVRPAIRALANRGKEALTLDLKSEAGRAIFLRLLDEADVVLESFRPGVMERLGLGYEALAARRPSIVHCAITGYGHSGPRRNAAGHDINFLAATGVLDQTGREGEAPVIPGFLLSDILGGTLTATVGILAALVDARATGHGRFIDVSIADAVLAHNILPLAELNESGSVHARGTGSHTGGVARYNVYACRDGRYLAVGAQEKKFWDVLCEALELPALKERHQAKGEAAREARAELAREFARRDAADWAARLEPLDCCVSLVRTCEEAVADPAFAERGVVVRREGEVAFGLPFAMSGHRAPHGARSPSRGEHTGAILARLGYDAAAIERLRAQGVV